MTKRAMMIFTPILAGARLPERLLACLGAAICISLTIVVCAALPMSAEDLPVIVAPLGASAVLVLAVPTSPLAQPWSVVGGNVLSSLVGVAVYHLVPDMTWAAGLAVGGAILVMSLARCLHPPGGAAAMTAVIGSQAIHDFGFAFAFVPVGLNSIALVTLATVFNRTTGHVYPHQAVTPPASPPDRTQLLIEADIDAALEEMHESFDISREDLQALLQRAEAHAQTRRDASKPNPRRR